jgi:ribosomal protein S18 acetylase RimI-like enzyme
MTIYTDQPAPEITISRLKITEIGKVKALYESSSDLLKEKMLGAWPLTSRLGMIHLVLSVTPLRFFLIFEIKPFIAKKGEEILGFGYIIRKKHKHENLLGIFVREDVQGKGLGKRLLSALLEDEDEVVLHVAVNNTCAIGLYEKMGFEDEGTIRTMKYKRKK